MPQPNVRHGRRNAWEWGNPPARSAEMQAVLADEAVATTVPAKRAPSRKDTASWCKGKVGREHVPVLVYVEDYWTRRKGSGGSCSWTPVYDHRNGRRYVAAWNCQHREECANCGKVSIAKGFMPPLRCPDYPGRAEQKQEAVEEAIRRQDRLDNRVGYARRKPAPSGPQGYRRKREAK